MTVPGLLYGYKRNEFLLQRTAVPLWPRNSCPLQSADEGESTQGDNAQIENHSIPASHPESCRAEAISHAEEGEGLRGEVSIVAAGHSLTVVCGPGQTFVRGGGIDGALGLGEEEKHNLPIEKLVSVPSLRGHKVMSVSCGRSHTMMVTREAAVLAWGANEHSQLGLGEEQTLQLVRTPQFVLSMRDEGAVLAACGAYHSFIVTEGGSLFAVGWNLCGQIGLGGASDEPVRNFSAVTMPASAGKVVQAAGGLSHSVALCEKGYLYEWGRVDFWWEWGGGANQQPFDETPVHEETARRLRPGRVYIPERVKAVSCGFDHSAALTRSGHVYTFGSTGQSGGLVQPRAHPPAIVEALRGSRVTSIASGYSHTVAIVNDDEEVYAWRWNGEQTAGSARNCKPARVEQPSKIQKLRMVSSGCCAEHSIFCYSSHLSKEAALAFMMGTHMRLGSNSSVLCLDPCIAATIAKM